MKGMHNSRLNRIRLQQAV